jgi:predicted nucleotidyltransferase
MINSILLQALIELDDWLIKNNVKIDLDIIGGMALHLHRIDILRFTMDIDLANEITNQDVIHQIREIGRTHGLDETWIESPGIPLPIGSIFEPHAMFSGFKNMSVRILRLESLVLTKIAAYYDRKHLMGMDAEDIKSIIKAGGTFDSQVLEQGIQFIRLTRVVDEDRIFEVRQDLSTFF